MNGMTGMNGNQLSSLSGALRAEWCVTTHHSADNAPLNECSGSGMVHR